MLYDVDLEVSDARRVALLGRNGAGKTTLLKSVMNLEPRVSGSLSWEGRPLAGTPTHRRAQMGLTMVPEERRILPQLSVLENLRMSWAAVPRAERRQAPEDIIATYPLLAPISNRMGGLLSGGQQQLLAMARAALSRPKLLLLDEPTEGLAPVIVEQLAEHVLEICRSEGCGLLLCEQSIWFARRCTEHVYVLDTGRIVFSGSWEAFDADKDVQARALSV